MQVTINRDGQQIGEYAVEQIDEHLTQGTLLTTDHAWHEGLPDWVPITEISGVASAGPLPAPFKLKLKAAVDTPSAQPTTSDTPQDLGIHSEVDTSSAKPTTSAFSEAGVIYESRAYLFTSGKRPWAGHLRLTTSKLIFTPVVGWWPSWLDWLFQSSAVCPTEEIPLSEISQLGKVWLGWCWLFKRVSSRRFVVQTYEGEEFDFRVWNRDEWVTLLERKEKCVFCCSPMARAGALVCPACGRDQQASPRWP